MVIVSSVGMIVGVAVLLQLASGFVRINDKFELLPRLLQRLELVFQTRPFRLEAFHLLQQFVSVIQASFATTGGGKFVPFAS